MCKFRGHDGSAGNHRPRRDDAAAQQYRSSSHENKFAYRDGPNADYRKDTRGDILIESKAVKKGDRLSAPMGAGGGFAIRIAAAR